MTINQSLTTHYSERNDHESKPNTTGFERITRKRPSLVVGITGHSNLHPDDVAAVKESIHTSLRWLRNGGELGADTPTGRLRVLKSTPLLMLSSLAPGADMLAVEVSEEINREDAAMTNGISRIPISLRAPLPFPVSHYPNSTTFKNADDSQRSTLSHSLRSLGPDAFHVLLKEDVGLTDQKLEAILNEQYNGENDESDPNISNLRRRRYRAAGEYVAAYSHVLIAVSDLDFHQNECESQPLDTAVAGLVTAGPGDDSSPGANAIVRAKLWGLTPDLLPLNTGLTWADSGPVIHIFARRTNPQQPYPERHPKAGSIRLLFPVDHRPEAKDANIANESALDQAWRNRGFKQFSGMIRNLELFNTEIASSPSQIDARCGGLLTKHGHALANDPDTKGVVNSLEDLAALRANAAGISRRIQKLADKSLIILCVLVAVAGISFHLFAHMEGHAAEAPADSTQSEAAKEHLKMFTPLRTFFLVLTNIAIASAVVCFFVYQKQEKERRRYDYRALAEGLRVQFHWALAGLGRSVSANYMQRQRGELNWIRNAISAVTFPYELRSQRVCQLSSQVKHKLLRAVAADWIDQQADYFSKSAAKRKSQLHRMHDIGWGLVWGGIMLVFLFLCVAPLQLFLVVCNQYKYLAAGGLVIGIGSLLVVRTLGPNGHDDAADIQGPHLQVDGKMRGMYNTMLRFLSMHINKWAIAFTSFSLCTVLIVGWMDCEESIRSGFHIWIISIGSVLLLGGLCIAWAEKSLLAEHQRQYEAMSSLFRSARVRLQALLEKHGRMQNTSDGASQVDNTTEKIHNLLFAVGKETLDENAEWLMLHRARPLEPFVGG